MDIQEFKQIDRAKLLEAKRDHLSQLDAYVQDLYRRPRLKHLFVELTQRCNEHCFHCGSSCTAAGAKDELSLVEWCRVLDEVREDFDASRLMLNVTGGEPLLREDFFQIMDHANSLGFRWGMTSNATLITPQVARRLAEVGMRTISVSIDGLPKTHDRLRGLSGGYELAMQGIQNLIDVGSFSHIQVTTVVNHRTMSELDALFEVMCDIDIDSWRVINLEPMGRALLRPDLMCTDDDYRRLFSFIREKRLAGYPVTYGCSHYLGLDLEAEVRDWYFLCNAGVYTASVASNGDILACLDIPRNPQTIQGNIRGERLLKVWKERFELFRHNLSDLSEECASCEHVSFCRGGAHHSWDYDHDRQMVCLRSALFANA